MNKETAVAQAGLNSTNQYTPDGSLEYSQMGTWPDGTPRFSVTQTLSDSNQKLYDLGNQTEQNLAQIGVDQSKRIGDLLSTPLNFDLGKMPTTPTGSTARYSLPGAQQMNPTMVGSRYAPNAIMVDRADIADNSALEKQLIDLQAQRLNPELQRRRMDLDASLADKGIKANSDAYSRAVTDNGMLENDARNQMILNGQQQAFQQALARSQNTFSQDLSRTGQFWNQGAQKAQQDFGQDLAANNQFFSQGLAGRQQYFTEAGANVQNEQQQDQTNFDRAWQTYTGEMQQRQQTIDEILRQRSTPINEITALMAGSQIAQPSWTSTPQTSIAPTDFIGLVNNQYNAKMQGYGGMLSGIGSVVGNLFKMAPGIPTPSDRRLKTDVREVGTMANGLPVYRFRYKGEDPSEYVGLMAQDVIHVQPAAVSVMPNGYLAIDYSQIQDA